MPTVPRVHSSDTQVFLNNTRLTGIQSVEFDTEKQITELTKLGQFGTQDRILTSNQTTNLKLDFILACDVANDPFFGFQNSGILSVEKFNFKVIDTVGQNLISGAYLSNYSLNFGVGELVKGSVSYEADTIVFNNSSFLTQNDQSDDSFEVFKPSDVNVSTDFAEGINSNSFCIQNASISFDISRTPVTRIGERIPRYRYPDTNGNGSVSFSIIKNSLTGIDLSSLVLDKGALTFDLTNDTCNVVIDVNNASLVSVSESNDLDGNATIDFNYTFSLVNSSVTQTTY